MVKLKPSVGENSAIIEPESAAWLTVALATVKLLASTPLRVNPGFGVSSRLAVYTVLAAKMAGDEFQLMVPVYCAVSIAVVAGVAPVTGTITPGIVKRVISDVVVGGNTASTVPESAA